MSIKADPKRARELAEDIRPRHSYFPGVTRELIYAADQLEALADEVEKLREQLADCYEDVKDRQLGNYLP